MGGGPTQSSNSSPPSIPPQLQPLMNAGYLEQINAMGELPQLSQLFGMVPQLGVPPLTGGQQQDIRGIQGMANTNGYFPYEQSSANTMGQIASPQASQQAFEQFAAPEVMQQAALSGTANGGAVPYSLSQAAIPYELQAQQTQLQAAQDQAGLGQQQTLNQINELTNALQAQGMSRDVAMQIAQSQFNQQQQQWGYAKDIQTWPLSLAGQSIGGGSSTINTGGKF